MAVARERGRKNKRGSPDWMVPMIKRVTQLATGFAWKPAAYT
jgi:hypothetical protein